MSGIFNTQTLATVAYAEIDGTAGASTATNSGITTTRTALGVYVAILPTGLFQAEARDLIFVQVKREGAGVMTDVDDSLDATKTITLWDGNPANGAATKIDASFSILILRTTITPPTGAPA